MLRIIGRIILVPLGIALAALTGLVFLTGVGLVQPGFSEVLATQASEQMQRLMRGLLAGEDVIGSFLPSLAAFSRLAGVVLFLPMMLVAAVAEVFALRSFFIQILLVAFLTALLPYAVMPELTAGTLFASSLSGLLAVTGALAGSVYWMVAGRKAGADTPSIEDRATVQAPKPSRDLKS